MAHTNFRQLQTLLTLLDDSRNDLYLHISKGAEPHPSFIVRHSQLIYVDPIAVTWGGHSQIQCELHLLSAAIPGGYQYYHLISGMDLPIKTQNQIHQFFDTHNGDEFIASDPVSNETGSYQVRVQYYYPMQNICGRDMHLPLRLLRQLDKAAVFLQKISGFRRKEIVPAYKGISWFSITDDMARYLLSRYDDIRKQFFYTFCADEIFLLSMAMASPYRDRIVDNSLRAIDWHRGCPYTYRTEDVPQLMHLGDDVLWARKFDETADAQVIDQIAALLST